MEMKYFPTEVLLDGVVKIYW